jgi:type IV pilus assembly protein PilY1
MSFDAMTGTLWLGDAAGGVWSLNISGMPTLDTATALKLGTTSPAQPVNYVGYGESGGLPSSGRPRATRSPCSRRRAAPVLPPGQAKAALSPGYRNGSAVASTVVRPLQLNGLVSAAPVLANGVLVVPVFVPPPANTCGVGTGYYQLFDLASGSDPRSP